MSNRISIMVTSGTREQLQMAAMVASVGAVSGSDVCVFLSMNALAYFKKDSSLNAPSEGEMGDLMEQKNAPPFRELFQQAVELGDAKIHPCSMALDILGIGQDDLEDFLSEAMGLTKFLGDATDGQVWSF